MDWFIIFLAKYLAAGVVLIGFIIWFRAKRKIKKELAVAFILAGLSAAILSTIASSLYFHPRPFVVEHIKPLVAHSADNGFPSGHTTWAMTISAVVYFYSRRWGLAAFILSIAIGVGRVLAHVHSPVDIVAGLFVGAMAGAIGYQGARQLAPKIFSYRPSK